MQLRKYRFLLLIALVATIMLALVSCEQFRVSVKLETENDKVYETPIGEFDYSQVKLIVTYSDGTKANVVLTEELVPAEERLKLFHPGEQTMKAVYGNASCEIPIFVKRNELNGIKLEAEPIDYDGLPHTVVVTGELPTGAEVYYPLGNTFVNAGEHNMTAAVSCDGYETIILSTTVVINQAEFDIGDLSLEDDTVVYDEKPHTIVANNIPENVSIAYELYDIDGKTPLSEAVDAGVYIIKMPIYIHDTVNYKPIEKPLEATLTILPAEYNMSNVTMKDVTLTYDGEQHTIAPTGRLPEGVSIKTTEVRLKSATQVEGRPDVSASEAGEYLVTVSFLADTINHQPIPDMTATLLIEKATIDLSNITFLPCAYDFDGKNHSATFDGKLPTDVVPTYTYNGQESTGAVAAGSYDVKVSFHLDREEASNYEIIPHTMNTVMIIRGITYNTVFTTNNISYKSGAAPGEDHFRITHMEEGINVELSFAKDGQPIDGSELIRGEKYDFTAKFSFADPVWNSSATIPPVTGETYLRELIEVESIAFPSPTITYDGQEHTVRLTCELPADAVSYYNNKRTTAGKNEMLARIDTDQYIVVDANGKTYSDFTGILTIERCLIDVSGVTLKDASYVYDGQPHSLTLEGDLPEGVSVVWSDTEFVRGGTYRITATFDYDKENYITSARYLSAVLTISRKQIDIPSEFVLASQEIEYDKLSHSLTLAVPDSCEFEYEIVYENNSATDAGDYLVKAKLVYDTELYEVMSGKTEFEAHLVIKPKKLDLKKFEQDNGYDSKEKSFTQEYYFEKSSTNEKGKPHSFVLNTSSLPEGVSVINNLQASFYGIGQWIDTLVIGGGNYEETRYKIVMLVYASKDALIMKTYSNYVTVAFDPKVPLTNVQSISIRIMDTSNHQTYTPDNIPKGARCVIMFPVTYTNSTGWTFTANFILDT